MKKKILSLLVAVCLIVPCMILAACGAKGPEGKYTIHSIAVGETVWTAEDYEAKKDAEDLEGAEMFLQMIGSVCFGEDSMTVELKEDKTFVMAGSMGEGYEEHTGTWTLDGETLTLTNSEAEDEPLVCTYKDGTLSYSMEEGPEMTVTITLKK
ncbi:MAG: hypothetical protein IJW59_05070 [Clostridia bacterium]|nr:hypothetical protein [Clostridia bacterium]